MTFVLDFTIKHKVESSTQRSAKHEDGKNSKHGLSSYNTTNKCKTHT